MNDELIEEWGCEVPITFNTKKGKLRMEPGKIYNSDFILQPERSKREDVDEEQIYDRGSCDNILC